MSELNYFNLIPKELVNQISLYLIDIDDIFNLDGLSSIDWKSLIIND